MLLFIFVIFLLITNWFFSQIFGFIPYQILIGLGNFTGIILLIIVIAFLSWCFGD